MADASYSDEDSTPSLSFFPKNSESHTFKSILNEILPQEDHFRVEDQISKSLDQLSTSFDKSADDDDADPYRKRARVGNHYQAKIPRLAANFHDNTAANGSDKLLWTPFATSATYVEGYLKSVAAVTKLLLPMGAHLRDDEEALHALQRHGHDFEAAMASVKGAPEGARGWSEEECRNFESGLLNFGKNFFLIRKYKVATREVGELVQFYYLWKKTERYDLFAPRIRSGKKKYTLNPGISDLMTRYIGGQAPGAFASLGHDVQFVVNDNRGQNNNAVLN